MGGRRCGGRRRLFLLVAASVPVVLAGQPSPASPRVAAAAAVTPVTHIVLIHKENRSFDNYFGRLPGVDGATTALRSDGVTVDLVPTPDALPHDIGHNPAAWQLAYHGGRMDRFDLEPGAYVRNKQGPLALSQMDRTGIPNYWRYARNFGVADRFFASWKGASFANNLYQIAAQAGRYDPGTSCVANAAEPGTSACHTNLRTVYHLPHPPDRPRTNSPHWGCDAGPGVTVPMLNPATGTVDDLTYPCFRFPALPDLLTRNGVTWRLYTRASTPHHNALEAIDSIRNIASQWANVRPFEQFEQDAAARRLPNVSWIVSIEDEHPPKSTCAGESETVRLVNAVMRTPQWAHTAIIVVWDEWGGFYDHVPPPQLDRVSFGFRVPMLAISPYVKSAGYVSHLRYSHASLLKFVEANWGLPSLGADDARPDTGGNLMDFFDFSVQHRPALILTPRTCAALTAAQQRIIATSAYD